MICRTCNWEQPPDRFYKGLRSCKSCRTKANRDLWQQRRLQAQCWKCGSSDRKEGYAVCEDCLGLQRKYEAASKAHNPELYKNRHLRRDNRADNRRLKQAVMDIYGGKCACCGEAEITFLTIDHVYGGGKQDRASRSAKNIYPEIRRLGHREDKYQVLCFNCNSGLYLHGGTCPHSTKTTRS